MANTTQDKSCFDYEEEDLLQCPNDEIDSGLSENNIYYSFVNNVKNLELPEKTGTLEEAGTIPKPIEMETGHGFARLDCLSDENELTSALTGNTGNKKQSSTLDILVPGVGAKILGFTRKFKNAGLIFIVIARDGKKFLIGTKLSPARMEESGSTSGRGPDDNNGITFTITSRAPLFEYPHEIPLLPTTETTP